MRPVSFTAATIARHYNEHLYKINKTVTLKKDGVNFETVIKGVSAQGRLITVDAIEREFDFGEVTAGELVTHDFRFTNHSEKAITIYSAKPACGCTVTEFTEDIAPGAEGWVRAQFNTTGKKGFYEKTVTVLTSANEEPYTLVLRGEVIGD